MEIRNFDYRIPKGKLIRLMNTILNLLRQMQELFADVPEAIAQTGKIAEQCNVEIDFKTKHYPVYFPPHLDQAAYTKEEQSQEVEKYLWQLCEEGIPQRYTPERLAKVKEIYPDQDPMQVIRERLEYEMSIIVPKGMSDYLLIVWDFINWAKSNRNSDGSWKGFWSRFDCFVLNWRHGY